jgi:hypothetical protein
MITAPITVDRLPQLGVDDLVDYGIQFDPAAREFIVSGRAAGPKGSTYPAAVFARVEGVGDFRQLGNFTTVEEWFSAKIPEKLVAPMLDAGKPVRVSIKIVAFDLAGFYVAFLPNSSQSDDHFESFGLNQVQQIGRELAVNLDPVCIDVYRRRG